MESSVNSKPLSRNPVSSDSAYAVVDELEADGEGQHVRVTTIFLTASECPIGCNMCDLWVNTLQQPTPRGAIVGQIDRVLSGRPQADWIKLYNSGNFFDRSSIPPEDYDAIAQHCEPFNRVVVENHPALGKDRVLQFKAKLHGRLEIAVGLETVQPRWLGRLNKRMSRDEFDQYAYWLEQNDIDLRVFLMVGVPGINSREAGRWARMSARHACRVGARHISLIPARGGNGWNGAAEKLPNLCTGELESLLCDTIGDVDGHAVVTLDTWDLPDGDRQRIERVNLEQAKADE